MMYDARDLGWLEVVKKILDIMTTRVCACRKKYAERDTTDVVPRFAQILKCKRWDAAASMTVNDLEAGIVDENGDENVQ